MIFDLDGVLIHSMPMHIEAWQQYLAAFGLHYEDIEARMHGKRNSELVRDLIDSALADDVVFEHGAAKERLFRELLLARDLEQFRIPGLHAFLDRHPDVPKAVGTNAEPANLHFVLERFGLSRYFQATVDGSQVGRPKPFPDIYLKAAELLKVSPENCIVFEDSPTGATAGLAAGMRVVGIETTPTSFQGVSLQVPDFNDPRLEAWLQAVSPRAQ
jgi:HAD superfamily hydrolase (TIGR01509 family)